MGFKVVTTYPDFISACSDLDYYYGKNFKDLPDDIKERLNAYYDGCECVDGEGCNPDNVWVNSFQEWTLEETLVDNLEVISLQEFRELKGNELIHADVSVSDLEKF